MRLTVAMLEAMLTALNEQLAGDALQSIFSEEEVDAAERNANKAVEWIAQELNRRAAKEKTKYPFNRPDAS